MVHLADKIHHFDNENTVTLGQKKRKVALQKGYPYRAKNRIGQKKHLLLVL